MSSQVWFPVIYNFNKNNQIEGGITHRIHIPPVGHNLLGTP